MMMKYFKEKGNMLLDDLAWAGKLDQMSHCGPFHPSHSVILCNKS